jgi:tetratricopeptide (TPR) repeat protein
MKTKHHILNPGLLVCLGITVFAAAADGEAAIRTRRGRGAVRGPVQLALSDAGPKKDAQKAIDRAGRRYEQARAYYDEDTSGNNLSAGKMIDESSDLLVRARENMRERMFEVATQLANASYDMSSRAIALLNQDTVGPDGVRREISRTDKLLDKIDKRRAEVNRPDLDRLIERAHMLQNRARSDAAEGRYILAFEHTKRAREIARRVMNRGAGEAAPGPDPVAGTLALTDRLLDNALELARDNGDNRALRRLEEAKRIQRDAHEAYQRGNPDKAVRLSRRARDLTQETARLMQKDINDVTVRRALHRTDEILDTLRGRLGGSAPQAPSRLYLRAANRQQTAWKSFNAGHLRKALADTKVARNLASNALRKLNR